MQASTAGIHLLRDNLHNSVQVKTSHFQVLVPESFLEEFHNAVSSLEGTIHCNKINYFS